MKTSAISGVLLATAIGAGARAGGILYVDDDAPPGGDGTSWLTAFRFLQDALDEAADGAVSEIRVGQGTYQPDRSHFFPRGLGYRDMPFELIPGVAIKGGYLGVSADEGQDPDDRDIDAYPTVLSGDLLGDDGPDFANNDENSFNVVVAAGSVSDVTLDGVTITAGNANGGGGDGHAAGAGVRVQTDGAGVHLKSCTLSENVAMWFGGGLYMSSSPAPDQSTIEDCRFIGNAVLDHHGGGASLLGGGPIVSGCTFADNTANDEGGGLSWTLPEGATLVGCTFTGNTAAFGGGLHVHGGSMAIAGCTFDLNSAEMSGGGMRVAKGADASIVDCDLSSNASGLGGGAAFDSTNVVELVDTLVTANTAGVGGGLYVANHAGLAVHGGTWSGNDATIGGGLYNDEGAPLLTGVTFDANTALLDGGAYYGLLGGAVFEAVVFTANEAENGGGAHLVLGTESFLECTFEDNRAGFGALGGGLYAVASAPEISGTLFEGNYAERGGAIYATSTTLTARGCVFRANTGCEGVGIDLNDGDGLVVDCDFMQNTAYFGYGVGIYNNASSPVVANCRFIGNYALNWGQGIAMLNVASSATVSNCLFSANGAGWPFYSAVLECGSETVLSSCILWGNGSSAQQQIFYSETCQPTVNYSCIQFLSADLGVGNISDDPRFLDPGSGDHRLAPDSPCIDAGDNTGLPAEITLDLDGLPRFVDDPDTPDTGNANNGDPIVDMGPYEFCRADVSRDGTVDVQDLVDVILAWGTVDIHADTNADGIVNVDDLIAVVLNLGPCS